MMDSLKELIETKGYRVGGLVCLSAALLVYVSKRFYFDGGRCTSRRRLDGKTAIVTGSNTGIGKETALELAKRGARVILACRDVDRAGRAAQEIRAQSGNGNVVVEIVDLASLDSVRQFAQRINTNEDRLDILVNNADGFEMHFGVNHLGHFLLTNLLIDKLKASGPSRIVNVSALAYEMGVKSGALRLDDIYSENSYDPWRAYQQSKICNILFTLALSRRLADNQVSVNSLHPGIIRTEIGRYYKEAYGWPDWLFRTVKILIWPLEMWFLKSSRQGAQTSIFCCVDESLDGVTGRYFSDCRDRPVVPEMFDKELQERLWQMSEQFVGMKFNI